MDIFSNLMVIGECLLDTRRTQAFRRAITAIVKPADVVVDVGTGSGILAMMAARAGAKHVYAIDIAPDIVQFARENIAKNKLEKMVSVIHADAKHFSLPKPVDVVTMELMDTWLVAEQQAVAINELRKNHVIGAKTQLIPFRYQCAVTLAQYDFSFYGFAMPFVIQARNFGVSKRTISSLSEAMIVRDIDFQKHITTHVNETIHIPVVKSGICNAVILKAKIFLAPQISLWGTTDMNMPVVIPLSQRLVKKGKSITLHIQYRMGEGFSAFEVHAS